MAPRAYTRRRTDAKSVDRVLAAGEELIRAGEFHSATMDELARAAGISRATVFNRFGSKLGVLAALAERCNASPEMQAIEDALALENPVEALDAVISASCAIWEAQGFVHEQLNAIVVLEPDAAALIEEQREAQRADLEGLARRLAKAGLLRSGLGEARAAAALHTLTSLDSFLWLRREYGLSLRQARETITELSRALLRPR